MPEKLCFKTLVVSTVSVPPIENLICSVFRKAPQGVETAIVIGAQNALLVARFRCNQVISQKMVDDWSTNPSRNSRPYDQGFMKTIGFPFFRAGSKKKP